jgi:hypothetical protein
MVEDAMVYQQVACKRRMKYVSIWIIEKNYPIIDRICINGFNPDFWWNDVCDLVDSQSGKRFSPNFRLLKDFDFTSDYTEKEVQEYFIDKNRVY